MSLDSLERGFSGSVGKKKMIEEGVDEIAEHREDERYQKEAIEVKLDELFSNLHFESDSDFQDFEAMFGIAQNIHDLIQQDIYTIREQRDILGSIYNCFTSYNNDNDSVGACLSRFQRLYTILGFGPDEKFGNSDITTEAQLSYVTTKPHCILFFRAKDNPTLLRKYMSLSLPQMVREAIMDKHSLRDVERIFLESLEKSAHEELYFDLDLFKTLRNAFPEMPAVGSETAERIFMKAFSTYTSRIHPLRLKQMISDIEETTRVKTAEIAFSRQVIEQYYEKFLQTKEPVGYQHTDDEYNNNEIGMYDLYKIRGIFTTVQIISEATSIRPEFVKHEADIQKMYEDCLDIFNRIVDQIKKTRHTDDTISTFLDTYKDIVSAMETVSGIAVPESLLSKYKEFGKENIDYYIQCFVDNSRWSYDLAPLLDHLESLAAKVGVSIEFSPQQTRDLFSSLMRKIVDRRESQEKLTEEVTQIQRLTGKTFISVVDEEMVQMLNNNLELPVVLARLTAITKTDFLSYPSVRKVLLEQYLSTPTMPHVFDHATRTYLEERIGKITETDALTIATHVLRNMYQTDAVNYVFTMYAQLGYRVKPSIFLDNLSSQTVLNLFDAEHIFKKYPNISKAQRQRFVADLKSDPGFTFLQTYKGKPAWSELFDQSVSRGLLSLTKPEDLQIFRSFVRQIDYPSVELLEIYIQCYRDENFDTQPEEKLLRFLEQNTAKIFNLNRPALLKIAKVFSCASAVAVNVCRLLPVILQHNGLENGLQEVVSVIDQFEISPEMLRDSHIQTIVFETIFTSELDDKAQQCLSLFFISPEQVIEFSRTFLLSELNSFSLNLRTILVYKRHAAFSNDELITEPWASIIFNTFKVQLRHDFRDALKLAGEFNISSEKVVEAQKELILEKIVKADLEGSVYLKQRYGLSVEVFNAEEKKAVVDALPRCVGANNRVYVLIQKEFGLSNEDIHRVALEIIIRKGDIEFALQFKKDFSVPTEVFKGDVFRQAIHPLLLQNLRKHKPSLFKKFCVDFVIPEEMVLSNVRDYFCLTLARTDPTSVFQIADHFSDEVYRIVQDPAVHVIILRSLPSLLLLNNDRSDSELLDLFMLSTEEFQEALIVVVPKYIVEASWSKSEACFRKLDAATLANKEHQQTILTSIRQKLLQAPYFIEKLDALRAPTVILDAVAADPWIMGLQRLRHIQDINQNTANDPWRNELQPLLASSQMRIDQEQDIELVVEFVRAYGMLNLPLTFQLYVECCRARSWDDVSESTIKRFEDYGIAVRKNDENRSWRFPNPKLLLNELERAIQHFKSELLADRIPESFFSDIGKEQFARLIGTTRWGRGDDFFKLAREWQAIVVQDTLIGKLPTGYKESSFEGIKMVTVREKKDEQVEREEKLAVILQSKEVGESYFPIAQALQIGLHAETDHAYWLQNQKTLLVSMRVLFDELSRLINATPEQLDAFIVAEPDEQKKSALLKKKKALSNDRGRFGITKQRDALAEGIEKAEQIHFTFATEIEMVQTMELLVELSKISAEATRLLREVSAAHLVRVVEDGWEIAGRFQDSTPTVDKITHLSSFSREFIKEHYLHTSQDPNHTGHSPFSPMLREALERVWQQQESEKGKTPIEQLSGKIKRILDLKQEETLETVSVSMVPVTGLLRIVSGDIGDACYTSQHRQLANNNFPNVHAWIYVTDRGGKQEVLRGSLLGILTERDGDKVPTLVARANNPRENFVQSIRPEEFVLSTLQTVIETARRMREARVKSGTVVLAQQRQAVVIPLDQASMSSTNRTSVAQTYQKRFHSLTKVSLTNTLDTNFNGYPIWSKDGGSGCATIWEVDEHGVETWFGDWLHDGMSFAQLEGTFKYYLLFGKMAGVGDIIKIMQEMTLTDSDRNRLVDILHTAPQNLSAFMKEHVETLIDFLKNKS